MPPINITYITQKHTKQDMVRSLDTLDINNKTVLLQSNLDVPLEDAKITDDTRLIASLQTIQQLLSKGCRVLICGHIGRPDGKYVESLSTRQLVQPLSELLKQEVYFLSQLDNKLVEKLPKPSVTIIENIRMWPGEKDDPVFAKTLASLADVYVNDDYIDSHRSNVTNTILPNILPSAMGRTLHNEYELITQTTQQPKRPYVAIIGGAKKDKIAVVKHLLAHADKILIGGILANTFLKASGVDIKASKYDQDSVEKAQELLRQANNKIILPTDAVVAKEFREHANNHTCYLQDIPEEHMILDIGSQTIKKYAQIIQDAKTIVWGGPLGAFETHPFEHGTLEVARAVAQSQAYSLIAGGDSSAAMHQLKIADQVSHISIGGGATLHLIAGDKLPAIEALKNT
jgi:phosphoglycerate kinase